MNTIETSQVNTITQPTKVLYTGKTHTIGDRDGGLARSSDGRLDVKLSIPGSPGSGTNPEQLFAAGWSACFIGAMKIAARKLKIQIPPDVAVDAEVDLCLADNDYFLQARLTNQRNQMEPLCDANYFIGMKHLLAGDKTGAADFFQKALNAFLVGYSIYESAAIELSRLKK